VFEIKKNSNCFTQHHRLRIVFYFWITSTYLWSLYWSNLCFYW
jgi:hypothetical protein